MEVRATRDAAPLPCFCKSGGIHAEVLALHALPCARLQSSSRGRQRQRWQQQRRPSHQSHLMRARCGAVVVLVSFCPAVQLVVCSCSVLLYWCCWSGAAPDSAALLLVSLLLLPPVWLHCNRADVI